MAYSPRFILIAGFFISLSIDTNVRRSIMESEETILNYMASLTVTIKPRTNRGKKFLIEMDADKFERLAANLGFFSSEFLRSLDKAEKDFKAGKVKKIKSLKELRNK